LLEIHRNECCESSEAASSREWEQKHRKGEAAVGVRRIICVSLTGWSSKDPVRLVSDRAV